MGMDAADRGRLWIHAGHGKTGSSFLQAWLAANAERLDRKHGLRYPLVSPFSGRREDSQGLARFSMGNGFILEELLERPDRVAQLRDLGGAAGPGRGLVFSRERFFRSLATRLGELERTAREAGFGSVEVLLFVRDPLEHAHSLYAEMVKAHGYTGSADRWLGEYELLDAVGDFLDRVEGCSATRLTVFNYSRSRERILDCMARWLGITSAPMRVPEGRANRSLTGPEVEVLRVCNRLLGASARSVGRRLAEELPGLRGPAASASLEAQETFLQRVEPVVERLNRRLPPDQAYALERPVASPAGSGQPLDRAQTQLVVEELGRLRGESAAGSTLDRLLRALRGLRTGR